jgi:TonB family protein
MVLMAPRKLWPCLLTLCLSGSVLASDARGALRVTRVDSLAAWERQLSAVPTHNSEFADVPHSNARSRCERTHPPEALTTPNPILNSGDPSLKVRVSFIVGADGRVHSPLILESAGTSDDQAILETVRAWRYRPAMCNGVPTETEGRIEFSRR